MFAPPAKFSETRRIGQGIYIYIKYVYNMALNQSHLAKYPPTTYRTSRACENKLVNTVNDATTTCTCSLLQRNPTTQSVHIYSLRRGSLGGGSPAGLLQRLTGLSNALQGLATLSKAKQRLTTLNRARARARIEPNEKPNPITSTNIKPTYT